MRSADAKQAAIDCGFDLVGIAGVGPMAEAAHFEDWARRGLAGRMAYLTDYRAGLRCDVRLLLPAARSVIVVGQLYNAPLPYSTVLTDDERAWISRYAWGEDYHAVMRRKLEALQARLPACESKICIDTAPVLERPLAQAAGLGWIGKNTCLINQERGSWFFLGELLTSLELAPDAPLPDRCGSCTRCIDACPTQAIVPTGKTPAFELDARLCIAYLSIELKGTIDEVLRPGMGRHVFGCDICQDVCPWNRRASTTEATEWQPRVFDPPLEELAALSKEAFSALFKDSPIARARYQGFLRNVAVAMGNARAERFRRPLEELAAGADAVVAEHARWALAQLE